MPERLSLLPSTEFEKLSPLLNDRVMRTVAALNSENFSSFIDPTMKDLLRRACQNAGADEGAIWLVDAEGQHLVICHAWGLHAEKVVGFRQSLSSGIVSMVFATEQPFCEDKVYANRLQARALDEKLGVLTCSMIAVPLVFAKGLRGVVGCIKVKNDADAPDPEDYAPNALGEMQFATHMLGRLIDYELVSVITGWDDGL